MKQVGMMHFTNQDSLVKLFIWDSVFFRQFETTTNAVQIRRVYFFLVWTRNRICGPRLRLVPETLEDSMRTFALTLIPFDAVLS